MLEKKTVSQCISADYCRGWNDAVDATPRWISVEERLPEDDQNVIVFVQHPISGHHWLQIAHMLRAMGMDECQDDEWWVDSTGEVVYYITHWMPLPEPPKEDLA